MTLELPSPGGCVGPLPGALGCGRLIRRAEACRLLCDPGHKTGHVRMGGQRLDGIELAFQGFLREKSMDMVVARLAEPADPLLDVTTIEIAFVPLVRVARARDKMMPSPLVYLPPAEFAMFALTRHERVS